MASAGPKPRPSGAIAEEVKVAATPLLGFPGARAYHTSVVLGNQEYYFDAAGIVSVPALWSHHARGQEVETSGWRATEVISVGFTALGGRGLMRGLEQHFQCGSYDVLLKNCNTFTDAALYFLTRNRLDARFSRLERLVASARPFSTQLLAGIARLLAGPREDGTAPQAYAPNPCVEGFAIENVIANIDALDAGGSPRKRSRHGRRARSSRAARSGPCGTDGPCAPFCKNFGACFQPPSESFVSLAEAATSAAFEFEDLPNVGRLLTQSELHTAGAKSGPLSPSCVDGVPLPPVRPPSPPAPPPPPARRASVGEGRLASTTLQIPLPPPPPQATRPWQGGVYLTRSAT